MVHDRKGHGKGDLTHAKPKGLSLEERAESRVTCLRTAGGTMRISDNEVRKLQTEGHAIVEQIVEIGQGNEEARREADEALVKQVTADVVAMSDREEMI